MLVLTRKIGQEVVLPEACVTITVVGVTGNRVRLGIVAPDETPVHRSEVWQRISESEHLTDDDDLTTHPTKRPDMDPMLVQWIDRRTGGRIRSLSVESVNGKLLIHGRTDSYYGLQLAQAAVREALGDDRCEVEFDIDVACQRRGSVPFGP